MNLIPEIRKIAAKKLIGLHITTSLKTNGTAELWRSFMPRKKEIRNFANNNLVSLDIFDTAIPFEEFNADTLFERWAAVEVQNFENIPNGMTRFVFEGGLYAVFHYKGSSAQGPEIFNYIFTIWLPPSGYKIDNRPHLAVMGEKYRNNDPDSEEELWIPISPI